MEILITRLAGQDSATFHGRPELFEGVGDAFGRNFASHMSEVEQIISALHGLFSTWDSILTADKQKERFAAVHLWLYGGWVGGSRYIS
jgi:hypothetical protein